MRVCILITQELDTYKALLLLEHRALPADVATKPTAHEVHLAPTVADKAAITATLTRIQSRITRRRDEALVLAQEAGMDIKSRLEDF